LIGSVLIWSALIMRHETGHNAVPFILLACSSAVALLFNLKGRLFSGSAGAYALSTLIGLAAIATYREGNSLNAELPVFWFWLPVVDCVRLMVSRLLERRSPFSADRDHIHHLLLRFLPSWLALTLYLAFLAAPGVLAEVNEYWANLMLAACLISYVGFIWWTHHARRIGFVWPGRQSLAAPAVESGSADSQ
jgi:UDP-GlcNAc:undecaprenyl-phosphate GlcNAc-1-phosphate transferase